MNNEIKRFIFKNVLGPNELLFFFFFLFVVAVFRFEFPHVLVGVLQVVVADIFQDLFQVCLVREKRRMRCAKNEHDSLGFLTMGCLVSFTKSLML